MSGSRVLISCKVFLKVSSSRERLSTVVVKQDFQSDFKHIPIKAYLLGSVLETCGRL